MEAKLTARRSDEISGTETRLSRGDGKQGLRLNCLIVTQRSLHGGCLPVHVLFALNWNSIASPERTHLRVLDVRPLPVERRRAQAGVQGERAEVLVDLQARSGRRSVARDHGQIPLSDGESRLQPRMLHN